MGYRNNPLMEPEFFTPPGSKTLYKGGGSSGTPYYANQDKLFGVQADVATNLYNQYASYAPQALQSLNDQVADANSGRYTEQLRNRAGVDSAGGASLERSAVERQMASMGVNPNDPRFAGALRATALGNAANMAASKNAAGVRGDDMAWARTQDFYNSLAGMPSQSASMLASAANGYGQMGAAMNQQASSNAAGYGQFGAQIASSMFKADGGYIGEPGFADGGNVGLSYDQYAAQQAYTPQTARPAQRPVAVAPPTIQAPQPVDSRQALMDHLKRGGRIFGGLDNTGMYAEGGYIDEPGFAIGGAVGGAAMPKLGDWRARPSGFKAQDMSVMDTVGSIATPIAISAGANALGKYVLKPAAEKFGSWAAEKGADAMVGMFGTKAQDFAAPVVEKSFNAAADAAGQAAAEKVGEAAAEKVGEEAAAQAGSMVPGLGQGVGMATNLAQGDYIGAALNAIPGGNYIDLAKDLLFDFADGGAVASRPAGLRLDMLKGGMTPDVGTETSDSIPAWLSKGEYVINADAVKQVGKEKLDQINERGLEKRYGKAGAKKAAPKKAPPRKAAPKSRKGGK